MIIKDYLETWWQSRNDNHLLFVGCIAIAVVLIFSVLFIVRKKRKSEKKHFDSIQKKESRSFRNIEVKQSDKSEIISNESTASITDDKKKEKELDKKIVFDNEPKLQVKQVVLIQNESQVKNEVKDNKLEQHTTKRQTYTPYIDENQVEIKIIKSQPESGKSEPKRIGYSPNDNFKQIEPYKYAVVKMPQKNSLIKFPRNGRSDKKGFKEDDFYLHLKQFFKDDYNVFNDKHIPTENGRPYEPDLILSNEKQDKNIFINIEIDEPYDGWMRTPTHCIGENDLRDDFFTKRGWIVIRFSEIQVHQEPKKCCALIAKVIASIDPAFKSVLINENNPNFTNQWNSQQAKKWASEKYREKYLGILNFGRRPNVITEYEITDSESDKAVEKEVPKSNTSLALERGKLATKNKNERDKRITFDPVEHRYFIDGNPDTISVTQLIDKFFPEFDSQYWAPIKAGQRGISTDAILAEWEAKRVNSANKGTALHEAIELFYNDNEHNSNTPEFKHFLSFKQKFNTMIPHRSEWRIFDEDLLIAGTIDMVYEKQDDSLYMFDWKRSEKVIRQDGSIKNETFQFAFGELAHLGDNSYNKYCLQQNIYKAILEKRYNKKISSINLLILHESYDRYFLVQIPNMEKEVNYILNYALTIR